MDILVQDLRVAWRSLAKTPGFAAIALLTIGLGSGLNATVFSFVDALLLRAARGVEDPRSLVAVYTSDFSSGAYGVTSYPDFESLRDESGAFASLAASQSLGAAILRADDASERVAVTGVSGDFFTVLGQRAAAGRLIGPADVDPAAPPVAVISYRLWQRVFAGRTDIAGGAITVNGEPFTVVGVTPARFDGLDFLRIVDLWTPLVTVPDERGGRGDRRYHVVGRLAPGLTVETAGARLSALATRLAAAHPDTNLGTLERPDAPRAMVVTPHARIDPSSRRDVTFLAGVLVAATTLVLLIACANVAGLLLSRATSRAREIAVRLALGASRGRLVRQLLTESLVLGLGGSAVGALFALWTVGALPSFLPPEQALLLSAEVDMRVLAVTMAIGASSALVIGLAPAFQSRRVQAVLALRGDAGDVSDARGGARLRQTLVAAQVALSCVLVVATALLTRSLANQLDADLGFHARRAVVATVDAPSVFFNPAEGLALYRQITARVAALPGVDAVGWTATLPFSRASRRGFRPDGYVAREGEDLEIPFIVVDAQYFATIGLPLQHGRGFTTADTFQSPPVAVVNDVLARRFFNGEAIGRRMTDSRDRVVEIVGVVGSGPYLSVQEAAVATVYYPIEQSYRGQMTLVARAAVDPGALADVVRRTAADVTSRAAVHRVRTFEAHLAEASAGDRLAASLVGACGLIALGLAIIGVYGVMSYAVARRTREIGVRITLGARPAQIVRLVLASGGRLVVTGTAIGLVAAALAARALQSLLYGVPVFDLVAFAAAPITLAIAVVLAAVAPVRRALRTDPVRVLRQE